MTEKFEHIEDVLHYIQKNLKAPKNQRNSFGNYNYRSCEDIVEALKGIMPEGATFRFDDEMVMLGNRYYVKATAKLCWGGMCETATGYAREPETKKGMDESQITGAASSYARKYAANALFMIDDTKDADSNEHAKQANTAQPAAKPKAEEETPQQAFLKKAKAEIEAMTKPEQVHQWSRDNVGHFKALSEAQKTWLDKIMNLQTARTAQAEL